MNVSERLCVLIAVELRFIDAVSKQELKTMHEMLEAGQVDVDESDYDLRTAMHVAASMGHRATVRILVERYNASHTVQDRYGVRCHSHPYGNGHSATALCTNACTMI